MVENEIVGVVPRASLKTYSISEPGSSSVFGWAGQRKPDQAGLY
jgi:hypothetical protein